MTTSIQAALLPLYVELYDRTLPDARSGCERIIGEVIPAFAACGVDVTQLPVCRTSAEFQQAVTRAEELNVSALITLHLAYSPSLESIDPLVNTSLPIIVLDTTTDHDFSPEVDPDILMYNHGIHGVQDMCNLLIRRGKQFDIVAGHWRESKVIARAAGIIKAKNVASRFRSTRAGRIGDPFEGMGDFEVSASVLSERTGITAVSAYPRHVAAMMPGPDDDEVTAEILLDCDRYDASGASDDLHRKSVMAGIAVRRWIASESLDAYALNFLGLTADSGFPVIPFLRRRNLWRGE